MANGQIYKLLGQINSDLINPDKLIFNAAFGGSFTAEVGKQYMVIAHTYYSGGAHLVPSGAIADKIYQDVVYPDGRQSEYYALLTATSNKVDFNLNNEHGRIYWRAV